MFNGGLSVIFLKSTSLINSDDSTWLSKNVQRNPEDTDPQYPMNAYIMGHGDNLGIYEVLGTPQKMIKYECLIGH